MYFLKFVRFKVSLAVAFAAFAAAVAYSHSITLDLLFGIAGTFLLACGASALNQVQEKRYDSVMERTSGRPLPSGVLSDRTALFIALFIILSGLITLFVQENKTTFELGGFNILWYNGLYTYLKRKSAFAVIPGSLTGAIPVLMGWTAAGGSLLVQEPWLLAFFMFMWQIPHFWLLMLRYGTQYQIAGLPALNDLFEGRQMKNIIFSWIIAASGASLMLVQLGIWHHPLFRFIILIMNFVLLFFTVKKIYHSGNDLRQLFMVINVFMMLVFIILIADRLLI